MEIKKIRKQSRVLQELIEQFKGKLKPETSAYIAEDLERLTSGSNELIVFLEGLTKKLSESQLRGARHDLRNILGAINGYSEMIEEETPEYTSEHQAINNIVHAGHQILDLVTTSDTIDNTIKNTFEEIYKQGKVDDVKPGNILVIDDSENNRELLRRYLEKIGHTVSTVDSANNALKELEKSDFDLILLDLIMPEISGFQLLNQLKNNKSTKRIPVIMVSGVEHNDGIINCIKAGAEDYISKPYNPILLQTRISASLEKKYAHDREVRILDELEKRNQFIRQIFGRYLSDEIVDSLLESPDGLDFGGSSKNVTILMTDIRSFTSMCEKLSAHDVVRVLNNYLEVMTEIIVKYQGTLDEIIGDALLIIFGAPIERDSDTDRAVACALEMQLAMKDVNKKNMQEGLPAIEMGIGINTGEVIVGNIGSVKRSKYAVVGHNVNVTARVESFTAGGQILISESTLQHSKTPLFVGEPRATRMKGVSDPVNIYNLMAIGGKYGLRLADY